MAYLDGREGHFAVYDWRYFHESGVDVYYSQYLAVAEILEFVDYWPSKIWAKLILQVHAFRELSF
jgi:hypothetical protein